MIRKYIIVADDSIKGFDEGIEKLEREWGAEEIEPCNDCVSRENALNGLIGTDLSGWQLAVALEAIEKLPPVLPQIKRGKWIETSLTPISGGDFNRGFKCSCCDYVTVVDDFNYCPNCGAKMEVEDDIDNTPIIVERGRR